MRSWIVQLRHHGKTHRITLGPVGVLPFEGPDAPGAADLARLALNAARRGDDPKLAIGRAKQPQGIMLADVWAAYEKAGFPLLNGIGFKRASSVKADGYRWKNQLSALSLGLSPKSTRPRCSVGSTPFPALGRGRTR